MFDKLSERFTSIFNMLGNKGRLSELEVDAALKEIRRALLEADVNFKVARSLVNEIKVKTAQEQHSGALTTSQEVIKATNGELINVLGGERVPLNSPSSSTGVILMVGLNGSGKTTTSAKMAQLLRSEEQTITLVAADVHRPAAIEQLEILGGQAGAKVFQRGINVEAHRVSEEGLLNGKNRGDTWVIVDTAGRSQADDQLMDELDEIKGVVDPDETLLVVDAMTGQDAVNVAEEFHKRIGVTGLMLTKMDGDARGGAALSITAVTGIPVKYVGIGETLDGIEPFYPDRLASRILGMSDMLSLIEKTQAAFDEEAANKLSDKMKRAEFDLEDYLEQLQSVRKVGGLGQILDMLPGFGAVKSKMDGLDDSDNQIVRTEAIIRSITPSERRQPSLIDGSRRRRIARGSGNAPRDVNQVLNQFKQVQKMMKQMSSTKGQKRLMKMMSQDGKGWKF